MNPCRNDSTVNGIMSPHTQRIWYMLIFVVNTSTMAVKPLLDSIKSSSVLIGILHLGLKNLGQELINAEVDD